MSKQSNQRYRKEKEKEQLKKEGLGSLIGHSHDNKDKINTEYQTRSDASER